MNEKSTELTIEELYKYIKSIDYTEEIIVIPISDKNITINDRRFNIKQLKKILHIN